MRKHLDVDDDSVTKEERKIKMCPNQSNKMLTTSRHLANPQIMHSERRAHECKVCDKAFKRKW